MKQTYTADAAFSELAELALDADFLREQAHAELRMAQGAAQTVAAEREALLAGVLTTHLTSNQVAPDAWADVLRDWGITDISALLAAYPSNRTALSTAELSYEKAKQTYRTAQQARSDFKETPSTIKDFKREHHLIAFHQAQDGWLPLPEFTRENYRAAHPLLALLSPRYRAVRRVLDRVGGVDAWFDAVDQEQADTIKRRCLSAAVDEAAEQYRQTEKTVREMQATVLPLEPDADANTALLRAAAASFLDAPRLPSAVEAMVLRDPGTRERFAQLGAQSSLLKTQQAVLTRVSTECQAFFEQLDTFRMRLRGIARNPNATITLDLEPLHAALANLRRYLQHTSNNVTRTTQAAWQEPEQSVPAAQMNDDDTDVLEALQLYWLTQLLDTMSPASQDDTRVPATPFTGGGGTADGGGASGDWDRLGLGANTATERLTDHLDQQLQQALTGFDNMVPDVQAALSAVETAVPESRVSSYQQENTRLTETGNEPIIPSSWQNGRDDDAVYTTSTRSDDTVAQPAPIDIVDTTTNNDTYDAGGCDSSSSDSSSDSSDSGCSPD